MKASWIIIALTAAACGEASIAPPAPDGIVELIAIPNHLTLFGPMHGRTIGVFARLDDGALEAIDVDAIDVDATVSGDAIEALAGGRVRARHEGIGAVTFAHGTHAVTVELEVLSMPPPFATSIVELTRGPGDGFGRDRLPDIVLGSPKGVGPNQGSTDALSLGIGGSIILGFEPYDLYDGPGGDLLIFENAFAIAGGDQTFAEPGRVTAFDCDPTAWPYPGCAGVQPVLAGPARPEVDATDPAKAGGDVFDLERILPATLATVEITDVATGTITGNNSGFDLDAIALVHVLPKDARALQAAPDAPRLISMGRTVPVPSFDLVLDGGALISSLDVKLELEGPIERVDQHRIRATAVGHAQVTARAGALSQVIAIEITAPEQEPM